MLTKLRFLFRYVIKRIHDINHVIEFKWLLSST